MIDLFETIFIWSLYVGLPLILILYFFDQKEIIICFVLIFSEYNIIPLLDEVSFPINSNREPITMVVDNKKFQAQELCSELKCGGSEKPLNFIQKLRLKFSRNSVGNNCPCPPPLTENSGPEIFDKPEKTKLGFPNGSGNGNGNFDENIGTKAWENGYVPILIK